MAVKYILKSSSIFDSVCDEPFAGGIVVNGNIIEKILKESEIAGYENSDVKVIDYGDKLIMPGFIDSHMHMGANMDNIDESYCVDLSKAKNFPEIVELMCGFKKKYPDAPFIYGINYNLFTLEENVLPTAKDMDLCSTEIPAMIQTWDCHTYIVNNKAIEVAGITKDTPDPNSGIEKDENGELTGVFNDSASFAFQEITERSFKEREGSLLNFMHKINECGITSVGDVFPCGPTKPYDLYKAMEYKFTARIHFYASLMDTTDEELKNLQAKYRSEMLKFSGLKSLLDGVLTVYTAWMLEPYANKPKTKGSPTISMEEFREKTLKAADKGVSVRVHAIGDAAIRYSLDVFEEAEKLYGKKESCRHNIEHVEYADPADIPRFGKLGVIPNMHFRHCIFYIDDAINYLGKERLEHCFNWRDVLDTGGKMATGSDFPVVYFNPMLGLHAAITRTTDDGHPEGGWLPEQKVSLSEAIKVYTTGSAYALNREKELGTLEAGKLADITVLDKNLFAIPTKEILDVKPVMTMVDGKIVYSVE